MHITIDINDFNTNYIMIGNKTKNIIIDNSDFYNLQYSNELFTSNNICFYFKFMNVNIDKYYNKYKCSFNTLDNNVLYSQEIKNRIINTKNKSSQQIYKYLINNNNVINNIIHIEKLILDSFSSIKTPQYKIKEQLLKNHFKILYKYPSIELNKEINMEVLLKISGIWVDNNNYGLTYKFDCI